MITPDNLTDTLLAMEFIANNDIYEKNYPSFGISLKADINRRKLFYPEQIK